MRVRAAAGAMLTAALTTAGPTAQAPPDAAFAREYGRLRQGPVYSATVPRGVVRRSHRLNGIEYPYTIEVPQAYDPSRTYQVRIQLHGGVSRPAPAERGGGSIGALAGAEQIYVMPSAWDAAPWWHPVQAESLRAILDAVRRDYNVDENRVVVSGVSDGGTGAFYIAMRDTTPYAAFLPLNGFVMILANPSLGIREQLFPNNLRNKPFFVVNGGRDQLYPTSLVDPFIRHLQQGGVRLTYQPRPDGAHNTAWWPEVKDDFEAFVRDHPRDPHPAQLTWEAEQTPARAHWLIVDRLAPRGAEEPLPDLNEMATGMAPNFGVRAEGMRLTAVLKGSNAETFGLLPGDLIESINGRVIPAGVPLLQMLEVYDPGMTLTFKVARSGGVRDLTGVYEPKSLPKVTALFPRRGGSGRVDLVREGNTVRAATRGVARFTLLLSPDVFAFSRPVTVLVNGRTAFDGRVEQSVETLVKWGAIDRDRTMLYGAELSVSVP